MSGFNYPSPGLNNVGEYQKSGQPFVSGGINATTPIRIDFPYVTKFIQIHNHDHGGSNHTKVAFSANGLSGSNYFRVDSGVFSDIWEIQVRSLWLSGSGDVDIIAGLTGIKHTLDEANLGSNWSGSIGVG